MTRQQVRWFAKGLRKADERGRVDEHIRAWLDKLLSFLDGDGVGGFTLERKWKRCPTRFTNPTAEVKPAKAAGKQTRRRPVPAVEHRVHPRLKGAVHLIDPSKPVR